MMRFTTAVFSVFLTLGFSGLVSAGSTEPNGPPKETENCGYKLQNVHRLFPQKMVLYADFYFSEGYSSRDRQKHNLFKVARILEDAGLLPFGEIFQLPKDLSSIPPFKLGETRNVSGQFVRKGDVEAMRESSPLFRFHNLSDGKIALTIVTDYGDTPVAEMDLGPFRLYSLMNITSEIRPMFPREFMAFYFNQTEEAIYSLQAMFVSAMGVERIYKLKAAHFAKWEDYILPTSSLRKISIRTDKVDKSQGFAKPIVSIKRRRGSF